MSISEKDFRELDKAVALVRQDLVQLKEECKKFATKAEIVPIRLVVYGAVSLILTATLTAIISGHIK
jgi:hypothetical protein